MDIIFKTLDNCIMYEVINVFHVLNQKIIINNHPETSNKINIQIDLSCTVQNNIQKNTHSVLKIIMPTELKNDLNKIIKFMNGRHNMNIQLYKCSVMHARYDHIKKSHIKLIKTNDVVHINVSIKSYRKLPIIRINSVKKIKKIYDQSYKICINESPISKHYKYEHNHDDSVIPFVIEI
jgi:hypothetical protein